MGRQLQSSFILVTVITIVMLFFNLGVIPLADPDEPVYAETAREMIQFNDYLSPRIYGEFWYDKPPMYYWLAAGSFQIFGVSEFAARVPSVLLGIACVLYVYFAVKRLINERAAMVSSLVLVTSLEFFYLAKGAVTDMTLTLCLTVALLGFLEKRYYLLYIFAALATVTKGPIGLVFPGAIIFLYWAVNRNFSEIIKMRLPLGVIIYAVIAVPWYWLMYQHHGAAFIDTFFGFHNIVRFTQPEHNETAAWYFFIPILLIGFMPWSAVMFQSIWRAVTRSGRDSRVLNFMLIWAAFIFVFFTISQTKLVSYIFPMFPPLAIVVGWYIHSIWDKSRTQPRQFAWGGLLAVFGILLSLGIFALDNETAALKSGGIAITLLFIVMIIGVGFSILRRNVPKAFWIQVAGMVVFSLIFMTMLLPKASPWIQSKDIAEAFTAQYDGRSPVYVEKFLRPGFAFYSKVYGIEMLTGDLDITLPEVQKGYFIVRGSEYKRLSEQERQDLTVIAKIGDRVVLLKQ
ncbi:MAG: hypothetical protein H6Q74_1970 [Firmicutes bacterium]|nr:hypothetical protein [Bacillota bacterium]